MPSRADGSGKVAVSLGSLLLVKTTNRRMAEAKWNHIILTGKVDIPQWTARWRNDLGDVLCKDSCYWLIDRGVPKGRVFIYFIVQTELHLRE